MKAEEICWECAYEQIERAVNAGIKDPEKRKEIIKKAKEIANKYIETEAPAEFGTKFHRFIKENSEQLPYTEFRKEGYEAAQKALEVLKPEIKTLKHACVASIIGNYLDYTSLPDPDKIDDFKNLLHEGLAIDEFNKFEEEVQKAQKILYLADNYGEHLFDLVVVQKLAELGKEVVVVGKESKILNDATVEDLKEAGFEKYAKVISIGSDCIGVVFKEVSQEFQQEFDSADLIISKGMGNYESLDEYESKKIAFLLRAKCEPVAKSFGVKKGSNLLVVRG